MPALHGFAPARLTRRTATSIGALSMVSLIALTGCGISIQSIPLPGGADTGEGARTYKLQFADGARGDDDGAMNGSVTDPGGPVVVAGTSPELAPAPSVEMSEKLASTGSTSESSGAALGLAVVAVLLGAGLLRFGVRRSRRREG